MILISVSLVLTMALLAGAGAAFMIVGLAGMLGYGLYAGWQWMGRQK